MLSLGLERENKYLVLYERFKVSIHLFDKEISDMQKQFEVKRPWLLPGRFPNLKADRNPEDGDRAIVEPVDARAEQGCIGIVNELAVELLSAGRADDQP